MGKILASTYALLTILLFLVGLLAILDGTHGQALGFFVAAAFAAVLGWVDVRLHRY